MKTFDVFLQELLTSKCLLYLCNPNNKDTSSISGTSSVEYDLECRVLASAYRIHFSYTHIPFLYLFLEYVLIELHYKCGLRCICDIKSFIIYYLSFQSPLVTQSHSKQREN